MTTITIIITPHIQYLHLHHGHHLPSHHILAGGTGTALSLRTVAGVTASEMMISHCFWAEVSPDELWLSWSWL